jgi:hypothetical protein
VYALKGLTAISITRRSGGTLRCYNDALFVLDTSRKLLVKLTGMSSL